MKSLIRLFQRPRLFSAAMLGITLHLTPSWVLADQPIQFNRDIRPILSETCFHCHGPDSHGRQADLRLDTVEGATADLGGYQPIAPGNVDESEAWVRIISDDPDALMPPPESHLKLTEDQKQTLRRWIEEGAVYEGHWAFQSPVQADVPEVKSTSIRNPVDAFVQKTLEDHQLAPSPEADPRTLIRRLSFDLIGLPPTIQQVRHFVDDYAARGEDAYQDAVTRLLASRHFGERMAVPWMDQARYADTNGYSIDGGREMWLWRDWVIEAYNQNKPFDEFMVEQLAGDLIPGATEAQRIATGFNRNHMVTHEGGTIPEENLTNYAADRVKTTSEVFLGLTMGCAQCHDHKYDPISQREYYQFFAFFNELSDRGLDGNAGNNPAPKIMATTVLPKEEVAPLEKELASLTAELATTRRGLDEWLATAKMDEADRGKDFQLHDVEMLDVSSPNRPGEFSIQPDGSVLLPKPSGGLNSMSHAFRLPAGQTVTGVRVEFYPYAGEESDQPVLTPFESGNPIVTTVLISADDQPAKQVDIYRQLSFSRVTASSIADDALPAHIIDERNQNWWTPNDRHAPQHLTITFDQPLDSDAAPFLSLMLFFGQNQSMPHHWKIQAVTGHDPDSTFAPQVAEVLSRPESEWVAADRDLVLDTYRDRSSALAPLRVRIANLRERIDVLTQPHQTMVMDQAAKPRETFVLARGQYDAKEEQVSPDTLAILPPLMNEDDGETQPSAPESSEVHENATRLDLARWLAKPDHPLTGRVAVNRLWSLFFGRGIVATSADFGSQGEWPSHPELLDYLATDFVANGWDQKRLIRQIVSSHTYRQSSDASADAKRVDPNNRLLARGPRFRLPAEFIRDQALATSGLLVRQIGGPSVHPYQPSGLWKEVSHFGSTPATKQVFVQDQGDKLYRRSLYTITKRTSPHPSMSAFDAPNREMCTVDRGVTNTPMQALVTLNDPQFAEAARVLAGDWLSQERDQPNADRLRHAFEQITGRLPGDEELATVTAFLDAQLRRYRDDPTSAHAVVSVGQWPMADDLDPARQAAWTQVASLLMNLSETLTRR